MTAWWHPDAFMNKTPYLRARAEIFARVREFFNTRGYLEVETPVLQAAPCMEAHIQGFKTELVSADGKSLTGLPRVSKRRHPLASRPILTSAIAPVVRSTHAVHRY